MKIQQLPLFFYPKEKRFYYIGHCQCENCKNVLEKSVIIVHEWGKKHSEMFLLCLSCFNKRRDCLSTVAEIKGALITMERPQGSFPVITTPPSLMSGDAGETVFSIAEKNVCGERVVDHTRLAGRESWDGAQVGCEVHDRHKDKALSDDSFAAELLAITEAVPEGTKLLKSEPGA